MRGVPSVRFGVDFRRVGYVAAALAMLAVPAGAQGGASAVQVSQIAPHYHLLSQPDANLVVFVGERSSMLVGVQSPALVARARELLRTLHAPRVEYVLMLEDDQAPGYGDGGWGRDGAVTMAHELLYARMARFARGQDTTDAAAARRRNPLPRMGFSQVVQVYPKGEAIHLIHERAGYTNADVIVHYEGAGLLQLGNTFTMDGYPRIEVAKGGSLAGIVQTADFFLNNFRDPGSLEPIVPGRGPVATVADLRAYRDMLVAVRDRVQPLLDAGKTEAEVVATHPSAEFDARWGHGPVQPDQFVGMVYRSLAKK